MVKFLRLASAFILALAVILSCTVVGNKLTDPETYSHTIEVLDNNRTTVLGLSAASAVASAAVSALPDDICSAISEELSEFTTWFTVILGFIYLEKYLLTILAAAGCYILLPLGCGALLINCLFPKAALKSIGARLAAIGLVVLLVIPASVWVSDQINAVYSESIELTIQSASAASDSLIGEVSVEEKEKTSVIDGVKAIFSNVTDSVSNVIEEFKNVVNRFVEATAVMIVTTCVIPVLVVLFFMWILKALFNAPVSVPVQYIKPRKHAHSHEEEKELTYIS